MSITMLAVHATNNSNQDIDGYAMLLVAALMLLLYFIPTINASRRHHNNTAAILMLNLFLGWTVLGWLIAFIWSWTNPPVVRYETRRL